MRKNKRVYETNILTCDQFNNCAECEEDMPGCCWWFRNIDVYGEYDKLPKIKYEYYLDEK